MIWKLNNNVLTLVSLVLAVTPQIRVNEAARYAGLSYKPFEAASDWRESSLSDITGP